MTTSNHAEVTTATIRSGRMPGILDYPAPIIDVGKGRSWAAGVEKHCYGWWTVLWEPWGQHLTAFLKGPWGEGGTYRKGRTPRDLWPAVLEAHDQCRRLATAQAAPVVPPLLVDKLPDDLWKADA
ncbi:hypothetical protein [Nonomuraea sp. B19D2]|uniref:hypothetical protein n=1 Tax=Nonomuraea sp. B19D2 TaxID=3159561 RepID=UPI0032DA7214